MIANPTLARTMVRALMELIALNVTALPGLLMTHAKLVNLSYINAVE